MSKVVIVTGASGTLGSAIALSFGAAGHKVLVNYYKSPKQAEEVVRKINEGPGQAFVYQADVRNYEQVKGMVNAALDRWGRLDVMTCVAGQSLGRLTRTGQNKLLIDHTEDDWDLVIDSCLKGTFNCIKAASDPMMAQKEGYIIIMGSGTGLKGRKMVASYAAAKAGLFGLMKTAALELGEYNIKVNAINPGYIPHPGDDVESHADRINRQNTLRRLSTAEEVAAFFVHLSGMNNISAQILTINSQP